MNHKHDFVEEFIENPEQFRLALDPDYETRGQDNWEKKTEYFDITRYH